MSELLRWVEHGGEWHGIFADARVASIDRVGEKWFWEILGGSKNGACDSREAAQAAAESAFKDWLRAAFGEPVAFVLTDKQYGSRHACFPDDPMRDKRNAPLYTETPLYALDTGEQP